MTNEELITRAVIYDATHADDDEILTEARERYARGSSLRGLRRPHDAPAEAYYSVQHRLLRSTGERVSYLYLRWPPRPDEPPGPRGRVAMRPARSLGRLDNGAP